MLVAPGSRIADVPHLWHRAAETLWPILEHVPPVPYGVGANVYIQVAGGAWKVVDFKCSIGRKHALASRIKMEKFGKEGQV